MEAIFPKLEYDTDDDYQCVDRLFWKLYAQY